MVPINLHLEIRMLGRISLVDRRADHGSRTSPGLDSTPMGFAINSPREAAHHDHSRKGELSRKPAGATASVIRDLTGSHDRNSRMPEEIKVARQIKISGPLERVASEEIELAG